MTLGIPDGEVRGRTETLRFVGVKIRLGERMKVTLGPRSLVSWAVGASEGPGKDG